MNRPGKFLALLLAGLAAGAVLWALTASTARTAAPGPGEGSLEGSGGVSDSARLARIEAELVALREALDARGAGHEPSLLPAPIRRDARPPAEGAPGAAAAVADDEAWRLALAALETRLLDELAGLREGLREDLDRKQVPARIRDAGRAIDWGAWEEVVALWHEDPDRARQSVKLLTADEVLERFGPPSDVLVNPNGLTWQYALPADPATGVRPLEIILRIPDGYVVQLAVRDQRR